MFQTWIAFAGRWPINSTFFASVDDHKRTSGVCSGDVFARDIRCRRLIVMLLPFWRSAEIRAAAFLRERGYRIVASGFRVREGEVDLIAWDGTVLVFIEVKSRQSSDPPEDAVGFRKRQRVLKAANAYISRHRLSEAAYRFDIVSVNEIPGRDPDYQLLRDAF